MPSRSADLRILVFGPMVGMPIPGVLFQVLHYMNGLRSLGFDPWYVEDSHRWVYDPIRGEQVEGGSDQIAQIEPFLRKYDLFHRFCYRAGPGALTYAESNVDIEELYRSADLFLNITGAQELRSEHLQIPARAYIESDPFAAQAKFNKGDADTQAQLNHHTHFFSFGENIGGSDCLVPQTGHSWLPTRQPVDLSIWPEDEPTVDAYRTITTWSNKGKDLEWNGELWYWTKDREFKKFLDLPQRVDPDLVLATNVDVDTSKLLKNSGWTVEPSQFTARESEQYVRFIAQSRGEFTIARDQYWRPRTGWFSDRSACYLASGRPVVTQETGFSRFIPTGEGLFGFSTLDEAVDAIETIESDYERHRRAAREIAVEYFDARTVLSKLIDDIYSTR
jgi:hypothetical protein